MANASTVTGRSIVGTFDSTGASSSISVGAGRLLDISIDFDTNTFDGTIQLQRKTLTGAANVEEWQTIEEYTASTEKVAQSAVTREYRLNCSVDNSGSCEFEMTAGARG